MVILSSVFFLVLLRVVLPVAFWWRWCYVIGATCLHLVACWVGLVSMRCHLRLFGI
jgi:hypothetical protein